MTALDESTHRSAETPLWQQGTLSDDAFERAALAITPSWELGLDAVPAALSAPPPAMITAGAFEAPSAVINSMLVSAGIESSPSLAPPAPTTTSAPPKAASVRPVEASMTAASAKVDEPARRAPSMRPTPSKRPSDEAFEAPKRASSNKLWAVVGGAMLIAGAVFVGVMHNSGSTPAPSTEPAPAAQPAAPAEPTPTPVVAAPEPAPTPVPAPEPAPTPVAAPEPPPAVVAAPEPTPAPTPPPVVAAPEPPPAPIPPPVVAAPEPPAPHQHVAREPSHSGAARAAVHHSTTAPAEPAHAPTPHAPSGAGFVTESPY